jgi:NADH:ubiquinone oxidoreductase subunit F (NADH-binding)/(2Fe-2S) ferredoxin/Pyruvate/2-oxoacid:ferredoxin oxidoreductase delta subunit
MTPDELNQWRDEARRAMAFRNDPADADGSLPDGTERELLICAGGACISSGEPSVEDALRGALAKAGLDDRVRLVPTGCMGACSLGPLVRVMPDDVLYVHLSPEDAEAVVEEHLAGGEPVERLLYRPSEDGEPIPHPADMPFFRHQEKIVLANCGLMSAESIDEYVGRDGYQALAKALTHMQPQEVIDTVTASGLRGRGGAGFPAGRKWQMLADAPGDEKYVICNADEGDPGAFMDRSILEGDPHRVVEAMTIAAYATGARKGYVYVRAEYPLAIRRLQLAIEEARRAGLLGRDILGTDMTFGIEVRVGAGAFVCGEETALMASVLGRRGQPQPRPPYPTQSGLYGRPTMINNVETLANIPPILRNGADWFRGIGTEGSPGTKVFALAGKVNLTGLVEVPMGTRLRDMVYEIGGGLPDEGAFKAAQTGGPSGGCIPAEHLDIALDFDSLQQVGSIMGSGGLIVMDDASCMVDVARFFMDFCVEESCGKCPPCRVGTREMHALLTDVCEGNATDETVAKLESLAEVVQSASLCGLGMTAPNPVLSTLRHFRDEYEAHVTDHTCPAGVCRNLLTFTIDYDLCRGCRLCFRNCPTDTIFQVDGEKKYYIVQEGCIHCGTCFEVCPFGAVKRE